MSSNDELRRLLDTQELAELGPGPRADVASKEELEKRLKKGLEQIGVSGERSNLIRGMVLLWHDHLDAAHEISQSIESADGALVHAIMHRREPDFGNAAYWFRRAGRHPAFPGIASGVTALLGSPKNSALLSQLVPNGHWDPFAFINACAAASNNPGPTQKVLREVQREEFGAVLDFFQGC